MPRHAVIRDADQRVINIVEWDGDTAKWQPPVGHSARLAADREGPWSPPPPTDDDLLAQQPRKVRLEPTAAAGKPALRDLLDEQVRDAQAWDWFAAKCETDALPAAAKTAIRGLATVEYERGKRLLAAWRAAN